MIKLLSWLFDWITWFPRNPKHFRVSAIDLIDFEAMYTFPTFGDGKPRDSTLTLETIEVLKHPLGRIHL